MTDESKAKLLQAYKYAIEAEKYSIAELLEYVILDVMRDERSIVIDRPRNTLEPPWIATCGPDTVPLSTTTTIDHTTGEVTS